MDKKRFWKAFFAIALLLAIIGVISSVMTGGIDKSSVTGNRIGVVEVTGIIKDSTETIKQISEFRQDSKIKAILIRIDSPGGAVGPSQEIYTEVLKTRKTKTVVASIGTLGASGGYYIASAASKIVANPGSLTGSIGVIMQFYNVQHLLDKIGVKGNVVKSGEFKDVGSPIREMTADEKKLVQNVIDDVHAQFIEAVAKGRNLRVEDVAKVADGRILTGKNAKNLKLIDELGNFNDAVEIVKKLAAMDGEPKLVYAKKKRSSVFDLLNSFSEGESHSRIFMLLSDLRIPAYVSEIFRLAVNE